MSPEANSEQGQDQATTSKFDTSVHPEGVREFGKHGDLSEMARVNDEGELETNISIPAHPGVINPHTHEVEVEKVQPLTPIEQRNSKRGLIIGVGSAAATAVLTAAAFMGLSGGEKAEPNRTETSTSVSPTPEVPTTPPTPEVPADIEQYMLQPSGTAPEVLANYSTVVSHIINERADAGAPVPTDEDLHYLLGPGAASPDLDAFKQFVQDKANNVIEARKLYQEQGHSGDIDIYVLTTLISSEPIPGGGFVIVAQDEYEALDASGMGAGSIILNRDTHRITFTRSDVLLPNGSYKNTFVTSKFETIQPTTE